MMPTEEELEATLLELLRQRGPGRPSARRTSPAPWGAIIGRLGAAHAAGPPDGGSPDEEGRAVIVRKGRGRFRRLQGVCIMSPAAEEGPGNSSDVRPESR